MIMSSRGGRNCHGRRGDASRCGATRGAGRAFSSSCPAGANLLRRADLLLLAVTPLQTRAVRHRIPTRTEALIKLLRDFGDALGEWARQPQWIELGAVRRPPLQVAARDAARTALILSDRMEQPAGSELEAARRDFDQASRRFIDEMRAAAAPAPAGRS